MFGTNTHPDSQTYVVTPEGSQHRGGSWNLVTGARSVEQGDAIWVTLDMDCGVEVAMSEQYHAELTEGNPCCLWTRNLCACAALLIVHKTQSSLRVSFTHIAGGPDENQVGWEAIANYFPVAAEGTFHCVLVLAEQATMADGFLAELSRRMPRVPAENIWVYQHWSGGVHFGIDWQGNIGQLTNEAVANAPDKARPAPASLTIIYARPPGWIVSDSEDEDDNDAASSGPEEMPDESA